MRTIKDILYEFRLAVDQLDSKNLVSLKLPAQLKLLNKAQRIVFRNRYKDFEKDEKLKMELQGLHIVERELKTTLFSKHQNIYTSSISDEVFAFTRKYALGSTDCCSNERIRLFDIQTDDIESISRNLKPSWDWRRANVRIADNKILVYSDAQMKIGKVVVDYVRYPKEMDIVGYTHFDGEKSTDRTCELQNLVDDIIHEAVFQSRLGAGDTAAAQAAALNLQRQ